MQRANRRNYYRILQVQPDAHEAVIRTAYRTLMQKLRLHPDLGGDGATAALINEAYAVLSDPGRRAAYDLQIGTAARRQPPPTAGDAGRPDAVQEPPPSPTGESTAPAAALNCLFCGETSLNPGNGPTGQRCGNCHCPLTPPPTGSQEDPARRAFERRALDEPVEYLPKYGAEQPRTASIHDFSPAGLSMIAAEALPADAVLAVKARSFSAVVRVIACDGAPHRPGSWQIRAKFLTLAIVMPAGNFVSDQA
jgi:hypothetical protein